MRLGQIYKRFFKEYWVELKGFFVILFTGLCITVILILIIYLIYITTKVEFIKHLIILPMIFWLLTIIYAVGRIIVFQSKTLIRDCKDIWKG